ncbi:MAG: hypothetical protein LPJ89_09575 [Hymenobacteraceae bacterium]|nr:hypothetical protein [Hymenobacteraceae bacterium]MDX5397271.1 hypothetical protein [Hymenobacteraceae bacterium]MDX5444015.1 hypothetical protein [Hymenobacteraceae bacterium]MDX5513349.1 hypothetical protein [Hymenobacteraceae bacterium]
MESDKKNLQPGENKPPKQRRVRVIEEDTSMEEMQAGHIIPGADHPRNEHARGGYGNRDGKEGFGSDSSDGVSSVTVNEEADNDEPPADNFRTEEEGRGA